jgi:hypothetical protein
MMNESILEKANEITQRIKHLELTLLICDAVTANGWCKYDFAKKDKDDRITYYHYLSENCKKQIHDLCKKDIEENLAEAKALFSQL